ncbi:DUF1415 domain-containing protein [bacterium]|nr:DUF1415 domain-containing protein [bacterium]
MTADVVAQTRAWIEKVVVGCNFCPFAARELRQGGIRYHVLSEPIEKQAFLDELERLDQDAGISTTFLILTQPDLTFDDYLLVVQQAQVWLEEADYEGVYQLASFHPDYCFADSVSDDAANFTNRSPHPMLHLLREEAVSAAIDSHGNAESIPANNIRLARQHGLAYMRELLESCQYSGRTPDDHLRSP